MSLRDRLPAGTNGQPVRRIRGSYAAELGVAIAAIGGVGGDIYLQTGAQVGEVVNRQPERTTSLQVETVAATGERRTATSAGNLSVKANRPVDLLGGSDLDAGTMATPATAEPPARRNAVVITDNNFAPGFMRPPPEG